MIAVAPEGNVRQVERAEQQRGIGQVDLLIREAADSAERTLDRLTGHRGFARRRGGAAPGGAGRPS